MHKTHVSQQFAARLRLAMLQAGFNSQRSATGVDVHKLVQITGYSIQICRKYLRGEVIPEPNKLMEIAAALQVEPGWLLFGETPAMNKKQSQLCISKNLLHYILTSSVCLYNGNVLQEEIPDFILELINDVELINADEEQSKKIIDLAISSVKHFNNQHGT